MTERNGITEKFILKVLVKGKKSTKGSSAMKEGREDERKEVNPGKRWMQDLEMEMVTM